VAAVEEERFTRQKHDPGFPTNAIEFCLAEGGIVAEEVDAVCFYEEPLTKFDRIIDRHISYFPLSYGHFRQVPSRWFGEIFPLKRLLAQRLRFICPVYFFPHHLSHAAYAFFSSDFDEAAVLVVDAVGEDSSASWGVGRGCNVTLKEEMPYPHSLGMLYTTITALLGFKVMDGEGTIMGLSAYGEPVYVETIRHMAPCFDDGSIFLKPEYFAFDYSNRMMSGKMEDVLFRARRPQEPIEQKHCDLAASVQAFLEERLIAMAKYVREKTGHNKVCLGGGIALNSLFNGKLTGQKIFRKVFIPPAPGDSGCAVGSALLYYYKQEDAERTKTSCHASLGTEYSQREIDNFLNLKGIPHDNFPDDTLLETAAKALRQNKIVGWFQGRMEFGRRALGNRSILASPAKAGVREILNSQVKGRESFRPFGASVLEEKAKDFFQNPTSSPFMEKVFFVRPECRKRIPAVVHQDGTCRIHTVPESEDNLYRKLIDTFHRDTGLPLVLNTSFNLAGEPIVSNPREAYDCFAKSGMDLLVLGNSLIQKKTPL